MPTKAKPASKAKAPKAAAKPEPKAADARKASRRKTERREAKAGVTVRHDDEGKPEPKRIRHGKTATASTLTVSGGEPIVINGAALDFPEPLTPDEIAEIAANAQAIAQGDIHTAEHEEFQAKAAATAAELAAADPDWKPERTAEHVRAVAEGR